MSRLRKAMFGGAVLSLLCVLFPPLFGEGYDTVKALPMEILTKSLKTVFSDILRLKILPLSFSLSLFFC
jgi:H+/Cl- antiporter ClcA